MIFATMISEEGGIAGASWRLTTKPDDDDDNDDDDGDDDDGDLRPVQCLLEGHDNAGLVGIFLIINFLDKGVYTNGVPRTTVWFVKLHCQIVKLRGISDIYLFISTEQYKRYLCYSRCLPAVRCILDHYI